jgi:acyl carrier protein
MISNLVKTSLSRGAALRLGSQQMMKMQSKQAKTNLVMPITQVRTYYPDNVLMPREYGDGYMSDPIVTAERIVRVISLHDNLKINPSDITVGHSFYELGLNELDIAEITLMLEREFDFEICDDDCESFTTINDIVENVARNFYAK